MFGPYDAAPTSPRRLASPPLPAFSVAPVVSPVQLATQMGCAGSSQVHRVGEQRCATHYLVVVHVLHDHTFARYYRYASGADLPLFRGMFLAVTLTRPLAAPSDDARPGPPDVAVLRVQQAFLPKFENEAKDEETAAAIVSGTAAIELGTAARYMVVSIKHSGSLATLSGDLVGAKNSVSNVFTSASLLVLKAHYDRVCPCAQLGLHAWLSRDSPTRPPPVLGPVHQASGDLPGRLARSRRPRAVPTSCTCLQGRVRRRAPARTLRRAA